MNRDDILALFDQAFGAGKYPRGPAIALGEELIGVGRREAGNMLLKSGVTTPRYKGLIYHASPVLSDSLSEVACRMIPHHGAERYAYAVLDTTMGTTVWIRDLSKPRDSLVALYLLAGLTPPASE